MRNRCVLFLAMLAMTAPLNAQDSLQQAQSFVDTVTSKGDVSSLKLPDVTADELITLTKMSACKPKVARVSTESYIYITWACNKADSDNAELGSGLTTELVFSGDTMTEFWIDPMSVDLIANDASLNLELPSIKRFAKQFMQAVSSGGDPSMGGLIPLTSSQIRRLKLYKGCKASQISAKEIEQNFIWRCRGIELSSNLMSLYFDDDGRPTGLDFGIAVRQPTR